MTIDSKVKRWLVRTYGEAFTNSVSPFEIKSFVVTVADMMETIKGMGNNITTVEELMDRMVMLIRMHMEQTDPFIKKVFVACLDQGSPEVKKLIAHKRRYKNIEKVDPGNQLIIPESGPLPMNLMDRIMATSDIIVREFYPLMWKSIVEKVRLPHLGQFVILQGCPSVYPVHPQNREMIKWGQVLYKEHKTMVDNRSGTLVSAGVSAGISAHLSNDIQEADDAVIYYTLLYARQGFDVWVYMNDGDAIPQQLANATGRLNPDTLQWYNRVKVELRGKATKEGKLKRSRSDENHVWLRDGGTLYVDINKLYETIINDDRMLRASVQNPILSVVALMGLGECDYFTSYGPNHEYRLFYGMSHEKYVCKTFYRYASRFSHMIQLSYGGSLEFGDHKALHQPYIDEYAFYEFCLQCYKARYEGDIPEKQMSIEALRKHMEKPLLNLKPRRKAETLEELEARKSRMRQGKNETTTRFITRRSSTTPLEEETEAKYQARVNKAKWKRLPPKHLFRFWARMLEYYLLRTLNAHRPNAEHILDPFRVGDDGRPYFPYIRDPTTTKPIIYTGKLSKPRKPSMPYSQFVRKRVMGEI